FNEFLKSEGLLPILRWKSIDRTQDEKTLKNLQNFTGITKSSTDTNLGLPIQPRLLLVECTPVSKVVLASDFYRFP
ncbi:hypothetical protein Gogos_000929, partial [Gossypium gossypioides]|nr:hypothetical protein [Gossypium gossypioides]